MVVTDRLHLKPLLPLIAEDARFYVLALSQNEVRLFQCSRYDAIPVKTNQIPGSLVEALPSDAPGKTLQVHMGASQGKGRGTAIFHGHGGGHDDTRTKILPYYWFVLGGVAVLLAMILARRIRRMHKAMRDARRG